MPRWKLLEECHVQILVPDHATAEQAEAAKRVLTEDSFRRRLQQAARRLADRLPELKLVQIRVSW